MIPGVVVTPLKVFTDDRGSVKRMLKATDAVFNGFGEVYFSGILPGKVKGWHRSTKARRHYAAIVGTIRLVLFDGKEVEEHLIGEENYCLITIPPNVWSSFAALGKEALVCDVMDFPYASSHMEKKDPKELTDCWQ